MKSYSKKASNITQGFSLIELMIVMAIIAILSAIILPNFSNIGQKAKETATKSNGHALQVALESYFLSKGTYPAGTPTIESLVTTLKTEGAITQEFLNPFTGAAAKSTDKSGKITYSANTTTGGYKIQIFGVNNTKEIAVLEN